MTTRSALIPLLSAFLAVTAPVAQEEPPLFDTPTPGDEAPAPDEPGAGDAAAPPAHPLPPEEPPQPPLRPLSDRLDHVRWQEMTPRERQTFVEGAVAALTAVMTRLRTEVSAGDPRATPERQAALLRFVKEHTPRRSATVYLRGMYNLYHTEEGRKLSMPDCFLRVYERLNAQ